jgi:lipopolysaccharide/colanic/teichoic acid biosynthesis glycosyltransferase
MRRITKRTLDIFLAISGGIISLPFWIICILLIWSQYRNKIFYLQERLGRNGIAFKLIKFRTMELGSKTIPPMLHWLRLTALDELPQLINILKGEMSFVGPRPLVKDEQGLKEESVLLQERLSIRPGLTGISQLLLPKSATVKEKFLFDVWYIRNYNIMLDSTLVFFSFLITLIGRWETDTEKLIILQPLKEKVCRETS